MALHFFSLHSRGSIANKPYFAQKLANLQPSTKPVGDCRVKEAKCISEQLSEISSQLQDLDAYRMVQLLRKGGIEYRAPFEGNSSHLSSPTCRNVGQARSLLSPPKGVWLHQASRNQGQKAVCHRPALSLS